MVLYRKEWAWVHSRLEKIADPTVEMATFAKRVKLALETKQVDPFFMAITENQARWIETRCKLITLHKRPPAMKGKSK